MSAPALGEARTVGAKVAWGRLIGPGTIGLGVFVAFGLAGLLWPYVYEPVTMADRLQGPSWAHPLGTDWLGRDLLRRLVASTRAFFLPGLLAIVVCAGIGIGLGGFAGYAPPQDALRPPSTARRRVWQAARGLVGICLAIPGALPRMVSLVLLCAGFGFDPYLLAIGCGVVYAGELGEDVRRRVQQCCHEEFVEASKAAGLSTWRLLGYHILWLHARAMILRHLFQLWAFVILVETSLSFMPGAFGIQEPDPSWGNMLEGTREAAMLGDVWAALVVTVVIIASIVLLAWVGDRLESEPSGGGQP